ncbi:MAG TPA: heme-binding protein [Microbacterium sp.]|nr:heme-binding protein [Microbacterium sp.]
MSRTVPTYTVAELQYLNDIDLVDFGNDDAVRLGRLAVDIITERDLNLAVDIVLGDDLVFRAKLKETGPGNDPWLRAKAAAALRFGEASMLVKLRHLEAGTAFDERDDVDHDVVKAYGGSIPLKVAGEIVGTITTSGEADAIDHETAAEALARYLARR